MKRRGKNRLPAWRGAAAMLVLAAMTGQTPAAAQTGQAFNPPSTPLVLTRTLTRALPDGKAIVSIRSYEVHVVRDGAGFRVDGHLVDSKVDAPPSLAALAELEQRRPDEGFFPILLDARGNIVEGRARPIDATVDRAASIVAERFGGSDMLTLDILEAQSFVSRLRNSARRHWPADLFNPHAGQTSETRSVPLPDGQVGKVTVDLAANRAGPEGQIAQVERTVTTDLSGDKRVIRERWQIARYAANSHR